MGAKYTVAVTGASGYIATAVVGLLINTGHDVLRISRGFSDDPEDERVKNIQTDKYDIDFFENIIKTYSPDFILILGAQTSAYWAEANPIDSYNDNVKPVLFLMEAIKNHATKNICIGFASTVTVFGLADEQDACHRYRENPVTIYDLHKYIVEKYLSMYLDKTDLISFFSLRLSNVYGVGKSVKSGDRGILNITMQKALLSQDINVYGDGMYVRDYVYIDDVARAFIDAIEHHKKIQNNCYMICSGTGTTILDAFKKCIKISKSDSNISHVGFPTGSLSIEKRNFIGDFLPFMKLTGWRPLVTLDDGLELLYRHYKKQLGRA